MTLEEFISEIESDLSTYANSGDIDRNSIKRYIVNELRRFGTNVLVLHEEVLNITNSQVQLPNNFRSLKLALKVEPLGWCVEDGNKEDFKNYLHTKRIEYPAYFNEVTQEYVTSCKTKVIEEFVTLNTSNGKIYYGDTQWLSLVKGIKRDGLSSDCLNLNKSLRNKCNHEINIINQTLNTNFNKGQIYIQYYGFEVDDEGEIVIPEGWLGNLEKYLEYYCKSKLAENLIANNKNPQALKEVLPIYRQESEKYFSNAQTEWKFKALGRDWTKKIKEKNRREFRRYILPTL